MYLMFFVQFWQQCERFTYNYHFNEFSQETEEELLIPPPPKHQSFNDDEDDVERRLQSLLDVAEEDKPDTKDTKPKDFSGLKELDRIGYVPSHPSQKMRNVQKGRGQARTSSFTGNAKPARYSQLYALRFKPCLCLRGTYNFQHKQTFNVLRARTEHF